MRTFAFCLLLILIVVAMTAALHGLVRAAGMPQTPAIGQLASGR